MMTDSLATFLNAIHPVEEEVMAEYLSHWSPVEFPRKSIITRPGEVQRYQYFVLEGIQRSYYLYEGKEHVIAFTYPPSFTGIPESFWSQEPSRYFLDTITASSMLRLSFEQNEQLIQKHRSLETLFRKGNEQILGGLIHRYVDLMAYDIETRFRVFFARSSHLLNQIPHKDLASYLRIDPTNFSKLLSTVSI